MMLTPTVIWLLAGAVLCLVEFVLPTAFIAFVMGLSALIVAALVPFIPALGLQIGVWMLLSILMVLVSRRFVNRKAALKLDATEAEVLAEILPGQAGRVLYEGNSWTARCSDSQMSVLAGQRVYVVGRKGTMLIVMPEEF
jgi:membrane protein implicated in regulation of membrane protease activity